VADEETADAAARVLRLLGDRTRLRLLAALAEGEASVEELRGRLGVPQALASFHLGKLRRAGLVRTRRDGRTPRVYYRLDPNGWAAARAAVGRVLGPADPAPG
jgi:DNA-binding transcriptional ArsR family regulator